MSLGQQVVTGLKQTVLIRFAGQFVTWVAMLYVVRVLSPEDYGVVTMAVVPIAITTMLMDLGLSAAVVQSDHVTQDELRQVLGVQLVVGGIAFVGMMLAAPFIAWIYGEPKVTAVLRAISFNLIVSFCIALPEALLRRELQFALLSRIDAWTAIAGATVCAGLAYYGAGVWALVAGLVVPALLKVIAVLSLAGTGFAPDYSAHRIAHLLAFGRSSISTNLLWTLYFTLDVAIIGRLLGSSTAGLYVIAKHVAMLPTEKVMPLINPILFRAFASIQSEPDRIKFQVVRVLRLLLTIAIPIGWGFSAIAPELVRLVLGPKWIEATDLVRAISLVMPFWMLGTMSSTMAQGVGHAGIALRGAITAAAVLLPGYAIGAWWLGLNGIISVWLVLLPLVVVLNLWRELRPVGVSLPELARGLWPPVVAGAAMLIVVGLVGQMLPSDWHYALRLPFLIGAGALTYMPLVYLLDRDSIQEVYRLARS